MTDDGKVGIPSSGSNEQDWFERAQSQATALMNSLHSELAIGQRWLLVIGALFFVFGSGLFLKYSFDQNWVPPFWRCASGFIVGMAFVGAGVRWRGRLHPFFGNTILGTGFAVAYLSSYLSYAYYELIPSGAAFVLFAGITSAAMTQAVIFRSRILALFSILGAYLAPWLVWNIFASPHAVGGYLAVIAGGLLWVARHRDWAFLTRIGLVATYVLFSAWAFQFYIIQHFWPTLFYITVYFVLFSVMPYTAELFGKQEIRRTTAGWMLLVTVLTLGAASALITEKYSSEIFGLYCSGLAAYFLTLSYFSKQRGGGAFTVLFGQGVVLSISAVAFLFNDEWTTSFWLLEAAALVWIAEKEKNIPLRFVALGLAVFSAFKSLIDLSALGFSLYTWTFQNGWLSAFPEREMLFIVTAGTLGWIGWTLLKSGANISGKVFSAAAQIMAFLFANIEVASFFNEYRPGATFAAISILWGLWSTLYLWVGFSIGSAVLRRTAIWLFLITAVKVLMIDLQNAATPYRILSFLVVGATLMGASYLYYLLSDRFEGQPQ